MAGVCLLFIVDNDNPDWRVPYFVSLMRAGICANFTSVFMAHPEFFPTLFVATSMGISNFLARLMVILAPLFAEAPPPMP